MKALSVAEMRTTEADALCRGWTEEKLLDQAGIRLGHAMARWFPEPGCLIAYLGKGHNAGDALVAAHVLRDHYGWEVSLRCAWPTTDFSPLTRKKWEELGSPTPLEQAPSPPLRLRTMVLLDGLLGIGATGAMRAPLSALCREMNHLRERNGARVAAADLPSGMNADSGNADIDAVKADVTFMIGNAKNGLLTATAANHTGSLALVPLPALTREGSSGLSLISPQTLDFAKSPRPYDFHKGMAGHVAILAGSRDYTGAAVLAAIGALRGGAGLVSLCVPTDLHPIIAAKCPPEVIVRGFGRFEEFSEIKADAWIIGCGLGPAKASEMDALLDFISGIRKPAVIDADALNWMALRERTPMLAENHLITPHPGEFRRLAPDLAEMEREIAVRAFTDRHPATLLLKGCRTLISRRGETIWCNSTGSPGMASGGQGDLLAGVIASALAAGHSPCLAAARSAWLCGRAAEIALARREISEESLLAGEVANDLGAAFNDWRTSSR